MLISIIRGFLTAGAAVFLLSVFPAVSPENTFAASLDGIVAPAKEKPFENKGLIKSGNGFYRFSYESVDMPVGDGMGFAGVNYMVNVRPWYAIGLGVYGALEGDYGGFFTGGIENEFKINLTDRVSLKAGAFIGGGGGAAAPQGGGLMIRPRAGVAYAFDSFNMGVEASRVIFPNGDIDSTHAAIFLEVPFRYAYSDFDRVGQKVDFEDITDIETGKGKAGLNQYAFTLKAQAYEPLGDAGKRAGAVKQKRVLLAGFEIDRDMSESLFGFIEANGAASGESSGYADLFFGAGLRYPVFGSKRLSLIAAAGAGSGGGGDVSTGGGFMYKVNGGVEFRDWGKLARLTGGYLSASAGDFDATVFAFSAGYVFDSVSIDGGSKKPLAEGEAFTLKGWRLKFSNQTYFGGKLLRKTGEEQEKPINLFGLKVDNLLSERFYLTGQALSAHSGDSGGFAAGLAGAGAQWQPCEKTRIYAEALTGAAGGGGVEVGGGAIVQPMAGVSYNIAKNFDIQLSGGVLKALRSSFWVGVADLGIVYQFGTISK